MPVELTCRVHHISFMPFFSKRFERALWWESSKYVNTDIKGYFNSLRPRINWQLLLVFCFFCSSKNVSAVQVSEGLLSYTWMNGGYQTSNTDEHFMYYRGLVLRHLLNSKTTQKLDNLAPSRPFILSLPF